MRTVGYIPEAEQEKKEPLTTTSEDTKGASSPEDTSGTPAGSGKKGNGKKEGE